MRWLLPVLSGVLFALAQPGYGVPLLSYVFLLPLLLFFLQLPKHSMAGFFLFELSRNILLLTFIPQVMIHYGGMHPALGYTGWIGLSLFLALLCIPFGPLMRRAASMPRAWLLIPLLYTGKDALLEHVLGGFPWCLLGYSQLSVPWLPQWAELGGVHLVTAMVILLNLLVFRLLRYRGRAALTQLLITVLILFSCGALLQKQAELEIRTHGTAVTLAILQPNSSYHSFTGYEPRLSELLDFSGKLARSGAEAVIWPEYSLPIYPRQWPTYGNRLQAFARDYAPLIGGFTDRRGRGETYNAVMIFDGSDILQYNKSHLAPFGEYIPFRPLFFFIRRITDEISDFSPGSGPVPLPLLGHPVGLPICYEAIFPSLVRRFVSRGAEMLIVTSNDSWYDGGKAHRQLLTMSAFRALENRRHLLRSTANGISAWVTPLGEIRGEIPYGIEGSILAEARFIRSKTLFTRGGVHFGLFCLVLSAGFFLVLLVNRYRGRGRESAL